MTSNEIDIYSRIQGEHRAIAILRILVSPVSGGKASDAVLCAYLQELALVVQKADVISTIGILERAGLVKSTKVDDFIVISLTDLGEDVALGRQSVEGVAKPPRDRSS